MSQKQVITTDYMTVSVYDDGKRIEIELQNGVKASKHNKHLMAYVDKLWASGVERIRADHVRMPYFDNSLSIARGNRKLDIVYYREGRIFECEFKTNRECGLDGTYIQVQEQSKHCTNFILLVPQSQIPWVEEQLRLRKIERVTVDAWDS